MSFLIFGGRSPIALALCKLIAENNLDVLLVTRKIDPELSELVEKLKLKSLIECDLEDSTSAVALASRIDQESKGLQGIAFLHRYRSENPKSFVQYSVEVDTPFRILDAISKQKRLNECSIVFATSPAATEVVSDQDFQYHASKAAVNQIIRFGSVNFAKFGLRVNGINPGLFVYKERASKFYKENPEILEEAIKKVPLGRIASVEEIASVTFFLLTAASSYINGQIINIDGGISNTTL